MIRKVSVVVSFVAIAALAASLRGPAVEPTAPSPAKSASRKKEDHPALASYRVSESSTEAGAPAFRGAGYEAEVTESGLHYRAGGWRMSLRGAKLEQGGKTLDLSHGPAERTQWATAQVRRSDTVVEEYLFENRRVEQVFRIAEPLATSGALTVRVAVSTDLVGPVTQVKRSDRVWKDLRLENGGLAFSDGLGVPRLYYHTAVAIDAKGRRQALDPRWEDGQIALHVPERFMKDAAYPVLVDPWLELDFSGTGGGVSLSGAVSEAPAVQVGPSGYPYVAWTEDVGGNAEIYFKIWNGFDWRSLGGSATGGGVSSSPGRSANPSLTISTGRLAIAWEDDSELSIAIFLKEYDGTNNSWIEVAGSADPAKGGASRIIGPNTNPQVVAVPAREINVDTPDEDYIAYLVVWEHGADEIRARMSYTGDDRGFLEGWYPLAVNGFGNTSVSNTAAGASTRPVLALDASNRPIVAWEDTLTGEHDIYVARYQDLNPSAAPFPPPLGPEAPAFPLPWTYTIGTSAGSTMMAPIATNGTLNTDCAFVGIGPAGASLAPRGICGAATIAPNQLSIQPSIAVNGLDVYVAWQESIAGGEKEIYLLRGNAAGWVGLNGSATGGGISQTTTLTPGLSTSSFPAVGVGGGVAMVAWEDDIDGETEIQVRGNLGAGWVQVGDEGSASPYPAELPGGNTGGISRNTTFSLRPSIRVHSDASASVAWRDGSNAAFDIFVRRFHFNQPLNLRQQFVNAAAATVNLPIGGLSSSTVVQLVAEVDMESLVITLTNRCRLQIECRPVGTPFNGSPTHESSEFNDLLTATVFFSGLPNENYAWQARTVDSAGRSSPWTAFGGNPDNFADFGVDTTVPGTGGPNTGSTTSSKDKCGLLGAEVLLALALAAAFRRRKA